MGGGGAWRWNACEGGACVADVTDALISVLSRCSQIVPRCAKEVAQLLSTHNQLALCGVLMPVPVTLVLRLLALLMNEHT